MKIAYVTNQYPPNITAGLGRYVEQIIPHLAERHRLAVFTLGDGRSAAYERQGNITVYRPGLVGGRGRRLNRTRRGEFALLAANVVVSNWRYFQRLRRARQRGGAPDLVVVHDSTNFLSGLLCHYVLRLPVVLHVHTTEYGVAPQRSATDPLNLFAALERRLGRIARRVVVATPEVRDQLAADGWDRASIDVVCLGGTFERALAEPGFDGGKLRLGAARLRDRLGIAASEQVLLFVGRLERQKGVYQLLEAMPEIAAGVPGLRLVIVGEGDAAGVGRIVADGGLGGRVVTVDGFFSGSSLMEFYEMADLCVFPSLFEPFGLVATEAMALGKPTVLGDGFSRVFLGDSGRPAVRFVRAADPADIARTVIEVMRDPELRRALGARGQRFVRDRLSWSRTSDETLAVYQAVLQD
ncbi:glycosyltransferase family 4 protein [Streptosporangiaceae bacterium NEAU-GS5]|nr:glycosyltransferase family 4 protein [Streptosporangiaceae bacterium NEAU-GS5]